jgi:hypothetical protein
MIRFDDLVDKVQAFNPLARSFVALAFLLAIRPVADLLRQDRRAFRGGIFSLWFHDTGTMGMLQSRWLALFLEDTQGVCHSR